MIQILQNTSYLCCCHRRVIWIDSDLNLNKEWLVFTLNNIDFLCGLLDQISSWFFSVVTIYRSFSQKTNWRLFLCFRNTSSPVWHWDPLDQNAPSWYDRVPYQLRIARPLGQRRRLKQQQSRQKMSWRLRALTSQGCPSTSLVLFPSVHYKRPISL